MSALVQPAHDDQHINRGLSGAEATLFLMEYSLGLAVADEAARDDLTKNVCLCGQQA